MKKVIVTGILGQDGSNMCEYLLSLGGYKVFGMIRREANPNFINCTSFLEHPDFQIVYGDLTDEYSIATLVQEIQPDYFINFAANSYVACSWDMPMQIFDTNALAIIRCLEALRSHQPNCRFYSAGSSEEFGDVDYSPQDMNHPMKPRSPYGASKCAAHHIVKVYRESYGLYAVHGVLFNHEGTKRGEEFVTRKITKGVARIYHSIQNGKLFNPIKLGNVYVKRDWSDSEDFVRGVWLMINQETPKDYILASGKAHTIKEFVEKAFKAADIYGGWKEIQDQPLETQFLLGTNDNYTPLVSIDEDFYRPAEIDLLLGDSTPAMKDLGWKPEISFDKLVEKMVLFDIENAKTKTQ